MFKTIYETRDQLIARRYAESSLSGFKGFVRLLKSVLIRYELIETRDELIARLYYESLHPEPAAARRTETSSSSDDDIAGSYSYSTHGLSDHNLYSTDWLPGRDD